MRIARRHAPGFLVATLAIAGVLPAAETHRWTVRPEGVTFEVGPSDVRAWRGAASGPPAFSAAAIVADRRKQFLDYAREQARELAAEPAHAVGIGVSEESVTFEVLSIVGPLVAYRDSSEGYTAGAAHPTRGQLVIVRDLSRPAASPLLVDLFPEKHVVAALKADRWIRSLRNVDREDREFQEAATVAELLATLNPAGAQDWSSDEHDCRVDVSFDDSFGRMFYFHHVEKGRVAVRVLVPPGSEWCNRASGPMEIGLLLPIPDGLRRHVEKARRGEAGFLAAYRAPFGALKFEGNWDASLHDLIRQP
jgi:hypothetical protein